MSPEAVRWYLEVALLVVVCFVLGAGAMAVALRLLLPASDREVDAQATSPGTSAGASS
jgi:hypothetical protein